MKKRGPKPKPETPYKRAVSLLLAREGENPPPQHRAAIEKAIADPECSLKIGAASVQDYVREGLKLLATPRGEKEWHDFLNRRERMWWLYHAICVEKREGVLRELEGEIKGDTYILSRGETNITPEEAEPLLTQAEKLLSANQWGQRDYLIWLKHFERLDARARRAPMVWRPDDDHRGNGLKVRSREVSVERKARMVAGHARRKELLKTSARDSEIRRLRANGMSQKDLALHFKLTTARICQICKPVAEKIEAHFLNDEELKAFHEDERIFEMLRADARRNVAQFLKEHPELKNESVEQ